MPLNSTSGKQFARAGKSGKADALRPLKGISGDFTGQPDGLEKDLLAAGADVNAIDDEGLTPLDRFRDEETAALLYKHGAKRARDLKAEGK